MITAEIAHSCYGVVSVNEIRYNKSFDMKREKYRSKKRFRQNLQDKCVVQIQSCNMMILRDKTILTLNLGK